jgi:uncharacterized protein YndB with AHSA1/START domain
MPDQDRIEKRAVLRGSRARIFRALTDASELGTWFRARFDGSFVPGKTVKAQVLYPGAEHLHFTLRVERIEPERYFAFRWHPAPVDPKADYSKEPTTLVEFSLEETPGGVALTVVESGFARIPAARRAEAFRMNEQGWNQQVSNLERYLGQA